MELIIVTGLSGAGKSTTLRKLEDMGFFCVDNLPCEMLLGFTELCLRADPPVDHAAIVMDSRESVFKTDIDDALAAVGRTGVHYKIIYLDSRTGTLVMRYNETRRLHPIADDVEDGIGKERELLSDLRDRADWIIDTSDTKPLELASKIENIVKGDTHFEFMVSIESFGYKRGVPFEADMVFDMRFLPNPFYEPDLRNLSGKDEPVREYVRRSGVFDEFMDTVEHMLINLIPLYREQGKHRLLVAFGCTGGRHRSVAAAMDMAARLGDKFRVTLIHRDMAEEAEEILGRSKR